jgi:hypothetical protein
MRLALLLAVLAGACSTKKSPEEGAKAPAATQFAASGTVQNLRFEGTMLFFCDARGAHGVDLTTGRATSNAPPCQASEEPNTACSGLTLDVSVRAPLSEPNDIVDLGASSFPLHGRVHDCRAAGNRLAIATGSSVVLIDAAKSTLKEIASQGSDRVAVADGWIAWTDNSSVRLAPIP